MKPVIKHAAVIFYPQGFVDSSNVALFVGDNDIKATAKLPVDLVLVSLKHVIHFNRNGAKQFVKLFNEVRKRKNAVVGFCDVSVKHIETLKKFFDKEMFFCMFENEEIARLFSKDFNSLNKTVLLYNDDKSQRSIMAIELHERGHNPVIAQDDNDFEKKKKSGQFDIIVRHSYLGNMKQDIPVRITANAVIYTLDNFLDKETVEEFNFEFHKHSLNIGFRLFVFDAFKVTSMNAHALKFFAKLAAYSAEYNATLCIVGLDFKKIPKGFKEEIEDATIMLFDKMEDILENKKLLDELGANDNTIAKQRKRSLTKQIVQELPRFVAATVDTLEMMTNAKAIKIGAQVEQIDIKLSNDLIASSIGFYGDLDGMIFLIFPRNIAKKACELLIGEETNDIELILDSLAELVNILGGKLKMLFEECEVRINITLPRVYRNIEDALVVIGDKKGVQVDLKFAGEKFTFFLTR